MDDAAGHLTAILCYKATTSSVNDSLAIVQDSRDVSSTPDFIKNRAKFRS